MLKFYSYQYEKYHTHHAKKIQMVLIIHICHNLQRWIVLVLLPKIEQLTIFPCIANLLDSIHRFVENLHKICYFMGLCVYAHRYFVFKTHMMHVIENIPSYLYMHHSVLDAQHPCAKNTNSWKNIFAWFPSLNCGMGNLWCVIQSTQLNNSSLHILSFDFVLFLKINFHVRCLNLFLNFNLEKKITQYGACCLLKHAHPTP